MTKYNVYVVGYQDIDCAYSPPYLAGSIEANSFREACAAIFAAEDHSRLFNKTECRYWGLRLGPTRYSV